ncbi:MAG TPA: cysteine desulfurase family protein [Candidatus Paceibacterota bacterium]
MKRIYLDYAAATPVDPRVVKVMQPYWDKVYSNPGSLHWFGQEASAAVFQARQTIAKVLQCHYSEIVFTGSATEANNLALRGAVKAWRRNHHGTPEIIISAIEHESIAATAEDLEQEGVKIVRIPVTKDGVVGTDVLSAALNEKTVCVSIIYAHNEIGTIQPLKKIAELIKNHKKSGAYPLFHTDAVQAFNYLECRPVDLGVDLLTLSSQKIYGPKGVGILYVRKNTPLQPIITGGGQESGLRSGTENVPAIVGYAKAVELAENIRVQETKRIKTMQNSLENKLHSTSSKIQLNSNAREKLPNILNIYVPDILAQELLIHLDMRGIAVSSGSACSSRSTEASAVIRALRYSEDRAKSSIRISMGRYTVPEDIDNFAEALKNIIKESPIKQK